MALRPYECDRDRLRLSLEDRLPEAQQGELAAHLEACPDCRRALERMAAASHYWGDAALLRGEPAPGAAPTGVVPAGSPDPDEEDPVAGWLDFLDAPDPGRPEALGRLGPYEVLEVLGRGGMGVVLKARDPSLGRMVAIKVLTPALAHGATARRRFDREARAIAAVAHEHIVAIHAVDVFRGLPYLVMQYVPGRSLQEKLDESGPLEVREILRIGTQAARALAAAHAQGVVHRDVKPANILLENCVERVKLTDFGLARAIDDASLTHSGIIAGTPQYMAPEQARGEPVDARADLFALGASLYAMAAGRSPFRADSAMAVLRRVCDDHHRPIRELNPDVPGWLEAAIDRLLAKDPDDRFQTAAEVADLLERGLAHLQQPTVVPPPVVTGFAGARDIAVDPPANRPLRRLAMAAAVLLVGAAGLGASEAAGLTEVSRFVATVLRTRTAEGTVVLQVDDPGVTVQLDGDDVVIEGAGPKEVRVRAGRHRVRAMKDGRPVRDEVVTIARGGKEIVNVSFEAPSATPGAPTAPRASVGPVPDSPTVPGGPIHAFVGPVTLRGISSEGRPLIGGAVGPGSPAWSRGMVWSLDFSPDGRRLAIGQQTVDRPDSNLWVWDLARRSDTFRVPYRSAGYRSVAFSPDGKVLAAGLFDGTLMTFEDVGATRRDTRENQPSAINAIVFLPGSRTIAAGDWDGWVKFHGPDPAACTRPIRYPGRVWSLAVSPDGSTLAVGGEAKTVQVYDLKTRELKATLGRHGHPVESLAFSPDGQRLVSAGGYLVCFWETATWKDAEPPIHHLPEVICVRFSPDGKLLALSDGESFLPHYQVLKTSVMLWDVAKHAEVRRLWGHTNTIWALAFSPDGKTLASGSADQTVRLWDVASGRLREMVTPGEWGTGDAMGAISVREPETVARPASAP